MSQSPQDPASLEPPPVMSAPPMAGPPPAYPGAYPPPPGMMPPGAMYPGMMPPPGYPQQTLGYAGYQQGFYGKPGLTPEQAARARSLVMVSNICGWGGLLGAIFGSIAAGLITHSGAAAGIVAVVGVVICVVGAIIGQIGRGMQGRVM